MKAEKHQQLHFVAQKSKNCYIWPKKHQNLQLLLQVAFCKYAPALILELLNIIQAISSKNLALFTKQKQLMDFPRIWEQIKSVMYCSFSKKMFLCSPFFWKIFLSYMPNGGNLKSFLCIKNESPSNNLYHIFNFLLCASIFFVDMTLRFVKTCSFKTRPPS